ncbi:MAG: LysR family transcriptional regulator [Eggerthellaceae bacterium]|nr:LysR family transcriptional regulator [Eggerthellaceae bacterium]
MELTQLRYFTEVARTQHMTKSAKRLHVAQPALSQSIHRLEDELGVRLFERQGRNICLTEEGKRFQARVSPLIASLDDAVEETRREASDQLPVVRVGIFSASSLVVDAIASFMAEEPEVAFEVVQHEGEANVHVSVRTLPPSKGRRRVAAGEVASFSEAIGVAAPKRAGMEGPVALSAFEQERFISLAGSRSFRSLCDSLCAGQGFFPRVVFDSDSPALVRKMIGLGLGVGFWPEFSWGPVASSDVRWHPLEDPGFERTLIVERAPARDDQTEAACERFCTHLISHIQSAWR